MNEICDVQFGSMSGMFLALAENQEIMKKYKVDPEMKEKDVMEEFAQLSCVLDEYFVELGIKTPAPIANSFQTLLSLFNRRSPNLKTLNIEFLNTTYKLANLSSESVTGAAQDFHLGCLTSLSLNYDTSVITSITYEDPYSGNISHQSILSLVGKFCPALIKLNVSLGFPLKKEDLLGLVLGIKSNVITDNERWNEDQVLVGLQIPPEYLNPLCLTLQKLTLSSMSGDLSDYWFEPKGNDVETSISPFVYAFALRQLPKLRKIKLETPIIDIFKIIYNVKTGSRQNNQTEFEEICRVLALQFGLEPDSITSPIPFTCIIKLLINKKSNLISISSTHL